MAHVANRGMLYVGAPVVGTTDEDGVVVEHREPAALDDVESATQRGFDLLSSARVASAIVAPEPTRDATGRRPHRVGHKKNAVVLQNACGLGDHACDLAVTQMVCDIRQG